MTQFLVTGLLACILTTSIYAQEAIEIELEGKFVSKLRNIVQEIDFKTRANVQEHKQKRETMVDAPPVVFNGILTIRSSREVRVIGVNVSFVVAEINLSEDLDLSRTKRAAPYIKVRLGLHSQFRLGGIDSQSLGIKLNLNINQIKSEYTPATSYDDEPGIPAGESRETFKFTGKVRHADENKKGFLIFAVKAGLTPKALLPVDRVNERDKRGTENQNPEIKLDGQYTYEYHGYYGDRSKETFEVTGELFTFEQLSPADEATPRKEFFAHKPSQSDPDVQEILVEAGGNVTASQNNQNIFQAPIYSGSRFSTNVTYGRKKRTSSSTPSDVLDIQYNGFFTETFSSRPQISSQRVSANFSLLEISRIRN